VGSSEDLKQKRRQVISDQFLVTWLKERVGKLDSGGQLFKQLIIDQFLVMWLKERVGKLDIEDTW
jgi:hypothetical protein